MFGLIHEVILALGETHQGHHVFTTIGKLGRKNGRSIGRIEAVLCCFYPLLKSSMPDFQDAFISYGRADSLVFAKKLHAHLVNHDLDIWFDQNNIPLGVDFQNQIDVGIEQSHNFLFIIAPHAVNSPYCGKEIELALNCQKRIIPLLHVEQISYETWQQRYPSQTIAQWQDYQAQGLHSSFPNMHPVIGKINWVYFREGMDDFDTSFAGLLEVMHRHRDYVHRHTVFLNQALTWSRNQQQSRYLLTGRDRLLGEDWLRVQFTTEQAPCEPTDLHCEFICESIKNANNLMAQVFLCYADSDRPRMENIRRSLMRKGFTVWTDTTDIRTGEDTQAVSDRGIEGADAVVYLLSQASLSSDDCQHQLAHAFSHHKRIIPLQMEAIDALTSSSRRNRRGLDAIYTKLEEDAPVHALPLQLRSLQFIDFSQADDPIHYHASLDKLIATLQDNAQYYELHKILLTRALKWRDQNRNTSILLRGYRLEQAEAWLKSTQQNPDHPPTSLQQDYINASLSHPPEESLDVFISYPMEEADFARRLNEALQLQGKTTWFDQDNVESRLGADAEVLHGLETCDNVLVIIAPYTLDLPNHESEVHHALQINKRIIPVLPYGLSDELPDILKGIPPIDFSDDGGSFTINFSELVRMLEVDRDHVHSHTHWLQRAIAWGDKQKNPDLLLRGSELAIANTWLREADDTQKNPPVTKLQRQFINASQQLADTITAEESRKQAILLKLQEERAQEAEGRLAAEQQSFKRQRLLLQVVTLGLFALLGAVGVALSEYRRSSIQTVKITSLYSRILSNDNNHLDALVEVLQARQRSDYWLTQQADTVAARNQVDLALRQVVYSIQEFNRISTADIPTSVAFSPDGQWMAVSYENGTGTIWTVQGDLKASFGHRSDRPITQVLFHPTSQSVLTASEDGTLKQWSLDGTLTSTIPEAHPGGVVSMVYSPDGAHLLSVGQDQTMKRWTLDGQVQQTTPLPDGSVTQVAMMPDGQTILTSHDRGIDQWSLTGDLLRQMTTDTGSISAIAIHPDGDLIAAGAQNGTVTLWDAAGVQVGTISSAHVSRIEALAFADRDTLVSAGRDRRIHLWSTDGVLKETFLGHEHQVLDLAVHPTGAIASVSADRTLRLWQQNTRRRIINAHPNWEINDHAVHTASGIIATASGDQRVRLWRQTGQQLQELTEHNDTVEAVAFSPNGSYLASGDHEGRILLWAIADDMTQLTDAGAVDTLDITLAQRLDGHEGAIHDLIFNARGDRLISSGADGTVRIWDLSGQMLQVLSTEEDQRLLGLDAHPTRDWIMVGGGQNLFLWDLEGKRLQTLPAHDQAIADAAFSPQGQTIATASIDGSVKLWQIDSDSKLTPTGSITNYSSPIHRISFSPSGNRLAASREDGMIQVWNLDHNARNTAISAILSGHRGSIVALGFGGMDDRLISGGHDGRLMIWDLTEILEITEIDYACAWVQDYLRQLDGDRALCRNVDQQDSSSLFDVQTNP